MKITLLQTSLFFTKFRKFNSLMGWKAPYTICESCSSEIYIEHEPTVLNTPAGEGRRVIELRGNNIKLVDPEIPIIYSNFEYHYCNDCEKFTDWFMAKYEEKENNFLRLLKDEDDVIRSINYFESNPQIEPRCMICEGHSIILDPKCNCGGRLKVVFKETGILSMQVDFSKRFYLPNGKVPIGII